LLALKEFASTGHSDLVFEEDGAVDDSLTVRDRRRAQGVLEENTGLSQGKDVLEASSHVKSLCRTMERRCCCLESKYTMRGLIPLPEGCIWWVLTFFLYLSFFDWIITSVDTWIGAFYVCRFKGLHKGFIQEFVGRSRTRWSLMGGIGSEEEKIRVSGEIRTSLSTAIFGLMAGSEHAV
jgi:hypothetical protein